MAMCFASESFILFLPSSLLSSEFIYTSDYEDRFNSLPLWPSFMQPPPGCSTSRYKSSSTKMAFCKALRGARSIIALVIHVGEGASAVERAAGKFLRGEAHADSSTHPNSP